MKLVQNINEENHSLSVSYIETEKGESLLTDRAFRDRKETLGECHIPEGIEVIKREAFKFVDFHTVYLPKSIQQLERDIFSMYQAYPIKIFYPGTSEEFQKIAPITKEEVCESDGFDRYPYYSGGSRWVTYYRAFDGHVKDIEVVCEGDGVTLLYGTKNRRDDEPPKIKANEGGV